MRVHVISNEAVLAVLVNEGFTITDNFKVRCNNFILGESLRSILNNHFCLGVFRNAVSLKIRRKVSKIKAMTPRPRRQTCG